MAADGWRARARELREEVHALYLAYRDPRTPIRAKGVIVLVVAYAVSPIDPIPDFLPGVGYLDELIVLPAGVALAIRLIPDDVMDDCRERAGGEIEAGRTRWIVAGLVLVAWIALGVLLVGTFTGWI